MLALLAAAAALAQPPDVFRRNCAGCHGLDGSGGERAPAARLGGRSDAQLRDLLRNGLPASGMPGFRLTDSEFAAVAGFVRSIPPAGRPLDPASALTREVPFAAIAAPAPGEWPTYHGRLSGNRHSPLQQIHRGNVAAVSMRWMFSLPGAGRLEVTPAVVDGVMYVTAANECYALDAATGRELWQFRRPRSKGLAGDAAGGINRGVAVLGTRVFMVTDNAHLLALDRASGKLVWDVEMADSSRNYGATSAPLVAGDLVVSGVSGGDEGIRGFVAAWRAETGEPAWRFWTVPAPGDAEARTWQGKAIEHGCGAAWLTGTYDPAAGLLYWTAGNPCPDYNGDERGGDNLYSDSVLALDARTGALRWHYQFTPHDLHDWDAEQTPVLIDAVFAGRPRRLLAQASRNGFFYLLDRLTGELLLARPFVEKLTWASGVGRDGRPILVPGAEPTHEGVRACPSVEGATNWMSTAFHPETGLFYVQSLEKCSIYVKSDDAVWKPGESFYGGGTHDVPGEPGRKVLRALDLATGKVVWEYAQQGRARTWGGVLSTAGGLVWLAADDGDFTAVDAKTGARLWSFAANQNWRASPMAYLAGGRQYVAIAGGPNILVFGLP